jgi:hypothetical protein
VTLGRPICVRLPSPPDQLGQRLGQHVPDYLPEQVRISGQRAAAPG